MLFHVPENVVSTPIIVTAPRSIGGGTIAVAGWPAAWTAFPKILTALRAGAIVGAFEVTGQSGGVLAGVSATDGYADAALHAGDTLEVRLTAGAIAEIQAAIAAIPPVAPDAPATATALRIAAWGDSLTSGYGSVSPYPSQLSVLIRRLVHDGGVASDTSTMIATRMLAATDKYTYGAIIWAGRGNITARDTILADIAAMVAALGHTRYLILSVVNADTEPTGSTNYNEIIAINAALASAHGAHYVDVRSYLVSQYDPGNPTDVTNHSQDIPPSSLRADTIHYNAAGDSLIAALIATKMSILTPSAALLGQSSAGDFFAAPPAPIGLIAPVDGTFTSVTLPTDPGDSALKVGTLEANSYGLDNAWYGENCYFDGATFRVRKAGRGNLIRFNNGDLIIQAGDSGSDGGAITPTDFLTLNLATGAVTTTGAIAGPGPLTLTGAATTLEIMADANSGWRWTVFAGSLFFQTTTNNWSTTLTPFVVDPATGVLAFSRTPTGDGSGWTNLDPTHFSGPIPDPSIASAATWNAKAPLASPTFSGVPAAPTAAPGTNTTQLATTAFSAAAIAALGLGTASTHAATDFDAAGAAAAAIAGLGTAASHPATDFAQSISLATSTVLHNSPVTFSNTAGAFAGTLSLKTQTANTVLAGPTTGSAATPTMRALVAADIPALPEGAITNLTTDLAAKQAAPTTTITRYGSSAGASAAGISNTLVGYQAGQTIATGTANTIVGAGSDVNAATLSGCTIVGAALTATGASAVMVGSSLSVGGGSVNVGIQNNGGTSSSSVVIGKVNTLGSVDSSVGIGVGVSVTHNSCAAIGQNTVDSGPGTMSISWWTIATSAYCLRAATSTDNAGKLTGYLQGGWATSTDATRKGRVKLLVADSTGTDHEGVRVESDGTQPLLGFYGAAAVAAAASPGTAAGTDAAVINAIVTILRNLGLCS